MSNETLVISPEKQKISPYEKKRLDYRLLEPLSLDLRQNPNEGIQQLQNPKNLYWQDLEILTPILGQKLQIMLKRPDGHVHTIILERSQKSENKINVFTIIYIDDESVLPRVPVYANNKNHGEIIGTETKYNKNSDIFREWQIIIQENQAVKVNIVGYNIQDAGNSIALCLLSDMVMAMKGVSTTYPIGKIKLKRDGESVQTLKEPDLRLNFVRQSIKNSEIRKIKYDLSKLIWNKLIGETNLKKYKIRDEMEIALVSNFDKIKDSFPDLDLEEIANTAFLDGNKIFLKINDENIEMVSF
jgi:hypothetical protein